MNRLLKLLICSSFILLAIIPGYSQKKDKNKVSPEEQARLNTLAQNKALCTFIISDAKSTTLDRSKAILDSIVALGASVNCDCELNSTQLNVLNYFKNSITNSLSTFFLHHGSKPFEERDLITRKYTPAFLYAGSGNLKMLEHIVTKHKADLNAGTEEKIYPLTLVLNRGNREEIKTMISLGADASKVSICTTDRPLIDFLLEHGASINQVDWECLLVKIEQANAFKSPDEIKENLFVDLLKKYNPDLSSNSSISIPNYLPLNSLDIIYSTGLKPNPKDVDFYLNDRNATSFIPLTRLFIKYKADLSKCERFGCPIEHAMERSTLEAVNLIADNGGLKVSQKIWMYKPELSELLIKKGLPVDSITITSLFANEVVLKKIVEVYKPDLSVYSEEQILKNASPGVKAILLKNGLAPKKE